MHECQPFQQRLPPLTARIPPPSSYKNSTAVTGTKKKKKENQSILSPQDSCSWSSSSVKSSTQMSSSRFSSQKQGRNLKISSALVRNKQRCIEDFAHPLGMSTAAIVDKVLERKGATEDNVFVDQLSQVSGDKFDSILENFEKSFTSTLMTLRLINKSTKICGGRNRELARWEYSSEEATDSSHDGLDNSANDFGTGEHWLEALLQASNMDRQVMQELAFASPTRSSHGYSNNQTILSTLEKSVMEQVRSNELKTVELGLTMKKLQLMERQIAFGSDSHFLETCNISAGLSKTSSKCQKFKTQLEATRHSELLSTCENCLVTGLFLMSSCAAYGVFIFSRQRITELTAACAPIEESKSWFMQKTVAYIHSSLLLLKCQFQVLTRMFAGGFMVTAIAYLLLRRPTSSKKSIQSTPVTFLIVLLVIGGISGKLCIDTFGGDGNWWLVPWWFFCSIHIFSNIWAPALFGILNGTEKTKKGPLVPYWLRRCLFHTTSALFLPSLCGLLPFASLPEWIGYFSSIFVYYLASLCGLLHFASLRQWIGHFISKFLHYLASLK